MAPLLSFQKPNVLIVIATGIIGGPGKGLFQLLKHSGRLGFDYTLCNFNTTYMKSGNDEFFERAADLGIRVHLIKQNWPIDPCLISRTDRVRRKRQSNIVQTHGYKPNVIGFFLKKLTRTPWIAFAHGYTNDNSKVRTYNRLDLLVLRYADSVVAVSNSIKKLLIRKGVKSYKIKIIHNAVDKDELMPSIRESNLRSALGIKNAQTVIGVVGRLGPEKGHIVFLKAFRDVLQQIPHATALIIGKGQEKRNLVAFCTKTNITSDVIFTGHIKKVAEYYQLMDLLVIPSFSEGLPNVLLEAMVLGIPVVATSVGGIPDVISGKNGVLIPPGDHKKMARAIFGLLVNEDQRNKLVQKAQETVLFSFDPANRAERIASLYQDVLQSR